MAARGPNPARGALKSGLWPVTDKTKMAHVTACQMTPLFWANPIPYFTPVSAAYTK